eukprot:8308369-Pyramimonas_sp.AAC.1
MVSWAVVSPSPEPLDHGASLPRTGPRGHAGALSPRRRGGGSRGRFGHAKAEVPARVGSPIAQGGPAGPPG